MLGHNQINHKFLRNVFFFFWFLCFFVSLFCCIKWSEFSGSIRVFCRVRPFLVIDRRRIREPILAGSEKIAVKTAGTRKEFDFDKVFPQETSQG